MSALSCALVLLFFLSIGNYWVQRSILYPPFIFSFMWTLDLALTGTGWIEVDPLHLDTLTIVVGGALAFSIGGLFASLVPALLLHVQFIPYISKHHNPLMRKVLLTLVLCVLPVYVYQVVQVSKSGQGTGLLMKARQAEVEAAQNGESTQSVVLGYFLNFSLLSSLILAAEKRDRDFWLVTGVAFIACIFSTGRTDLLLLFSGLSAIYILQARRESLFKAVGFLRWPVGLFILLFTGLIFTTKDTSDKSGGAIDIIVYFVLSYIVGPLAAFDHVVQQPNNFTLVSSHTFQYPEKLASALHLIQYNNPLLFDNFILVPFPTNVYTVYKFYFLELGIAGTLVTMFLFGFAHALLYRKAKQGSRFSLYLYAFTIATVLIVIFDDWYYLLGAYLKAFGFGMVFYMLQNLPISPLLRGASFAGLHRYKVSAR